MSVPWNDPAMRESLAALIERARREGKWLWCHYQDLWFSPDNLAAEHERGQFRWGPVNWELRDPKERLAEARERLKKSLAECDRIAKEIGG